MVVLFCFSCADAAPPVDFFAHPELLCAALEETGVHTSPWAPPGKWAFAPKGPYICENSGVPEPEDKANRERGVGTIFRVSGDTKARADIISIAVTAFDATALLTAQEEIKRQIMALFKSIGQTPPNGLFAYIEGRRYYLSRQSYGILWFNFVTPDKRPDQPTFWFRLSQ
jgi:hypothetical protein